MGNVASELTECKGLCSCEDSFPAKYGEAHGGGRPPEYPWGEEVCTFAESPGTLQNNKDMTFSSPGPPGAPASRTWGKDRSPDDSPASPASPVKLRQSWQDLDADGNYHLQFNLRAGDRFGLQLVETRDPQPISLLVVSSVEPTGPFAQTSRQSPGLFSGDVIIRANKKRGSAASLRDVINQVVLHGGELDLVIEARPASFDALIRRVGPNWKKLGLSVAIDRMDQIPRMRVRTVRNEGLVPKWNETHPSLRICQGDWITQINGIGNSAEEMHKMIQANTQGEELELRMETPSRDLPRQELDPLSSPMPTPRSGMPSPRSGRLSPMPSPRVG